MSASKLDAVYRSILINKFFTKGWGKPENLRRLFEFRKVVSNRDECFKLIDRDYPVTITKEQNLTDCKIIEGYFKSPLEKYLPGIVPEIAQKAHFQALLPLHWPDQNCKPVCLHLAGTGDHFFWRRRNLMAKPLIKEAAIGGIILENPFYGLRKPTDQVRSSLHNVSDIFVMGGCLILESLVLFHWCERNGFGPLGVTGLSMGGHMASLAATNWPKPLVLVPCLSWSTASAVFLQGVLSHSINWDLLEDQYLSDGIYREKLSKMVTIVDEAFLAGKKFAQTYSKKVRNDVDVSNPKGISPHKELDITYKEIEKQEDETQKVSESPKVKSLNVELLKLLEDKKISRVLYDKFTSNEKYELTSQDIEEINKLTEEEIKQKLLNIATVSNTKKNFETSDKPKFFSKIEIDTRQDTEDISTETRKTITLNENLNITNNITEKIIEREEALSLKTVNIIPKKKQVKKSWKVSDLTSYLNFLKNEKKIDITKIHWRDREALQFMRGVMDECTHLSNFSVPFDTSLIIAVCAKHDAYVPREDVGTLEEIWPGAEVRYVDAGHVSAYILHQSLFRSCIVEAFERSKKKWKDDQHVV